MTTDGRPLGRRLATTAGYGAAVVLIAVASPIVARRPGRATVVKAYRQAATGRARFDRWLDTQATPPPSIGDVLLESLLGALAARPPSATSAPSPDRQES
jgi:hypothetical protein